ncbi:hypothetical protein BH10CYA1_BH10CYA1_48390 [soil metagenome]
MYSAEDRTGVVLNASANNNLIVFEKFVKASQEANESTGNSLNNLASHRLSDRYSETLFSRNNFEGTQSLGSNAGLEKFQKLSLKQDTSPELTSNNYSQFRWSPFIGKTTDYSKDQKVQNNEVSYGLPGLVAALEQWGNSVLNSVECFLRSYGFAVAVADSSNILCRVECFASCSNV